MNQFNKEGKKHGPWEEYRDNGNLWYKANFVNGKGHGVCEIYCDSGNLSHKGTYVNGKRHGLSEWYKYGEDINLRDLEYFL